MENIELHSAKEAFTIATEANRKKSYEDTLKENKEVREAAELFLNFIITKINTYAEKGYFKYSLMSNDIDLTDLTYISDALNILRNKINLYDYIRDEFEPLGYKVSYRNSRAFNSSEWWVLTIDWSKE